MIFLPHSNLEPFFLWRVQPAEVVEPAKGKTTGKENEKAWRRALQGATPLGARLLSELIYETGTVGTQKSEPGRRRQARPTSSSM
jgi:hypothetical protein